MLETLILLAGIGQLILVAASAAIPVCLGWKKHLAPMPKLMRQLFWTYSGYILMMHLFFGVLSTWGISLLLDGSPHAAILCGLMACWWTVRIGLQFFCFDCSDVPDTPVNKLAKIGLTLLFIFLSTTYIWAVIHNLNG